MKVSCDGFAVFGSNDDASFHMRKIYDQTEWEHHFKSYFRDLMEIIWQELLSDLSPKYDFYVKMDPDAFLRPCALKGMLAGYNQEEMIMLSTGDAPIESPGNMMRMRDQAGRQVEVFNVQRHLDHPKWESWEASLGRRTNGTQPGGPPLNLYGTSTWIDGFFIVHSRTTAEALYFKLLQKSDCSAILLSGHDEGTHEDGSPDEDGEAPDMLPCFEMKTAKGGNLKILFPIDDDGYALISGLDQTPGIKEYTDLISRHQSQCLRIQPQWRNWKPTQDEDSNPGTMATPAAKGEVELLCFSHNLVLIHALTDATDSVRYYDATFAQLMGTTPPAQPR